MFSRLFPFLLICHFLQDVVVVGDFHGESNNSPAMISIGHDGKQSRKNERSIEESQSEQEASQDKHLTITKTRQRRHIGSVAAFRGLPEKIAPLDWRNGQIQSVNHAVNRNADMINPYTGLASGNPDTINSDQEIVMLIDSPDFITSDDEIGKNKRYPVAQTPIKTFQVDEPQYNDARMAAIDRLLRLISEARANSKTETSYKTKKHIGALARNNAVPHRTRTSSVPNKGSGFDPSPTKRTPFRTGHDDEGFLYEKTKNYDEVLSKMQDDSLDMYADDFDNDFKEQEESLVPTKRHLGSVFKSGWYHKTPPSRSSGRVQSPSLQ